MAGSHRKAAILYTDIKDFTRRMNKDEGLGLRVLEVHNRILDAAAGANGGRVVKSIGDSYLVVFDGARAAVQCALAAQKELAAHNCACEEELRVLVRMSVHLGTVLDRDGDVFGNDVNTAARILGSAPAGRTVVSRAVFEAVYPEGLCEFVPLDPGQFKGLASPVELFEAAPFAVSARSHEPEASADAPPRALSHARGSRAPRSFPAWTVRTSVAALILVMRAPVEWLLAPIALFSYPFHMAGHAFFGLSESDTVAALGAFAVPLAFAAALAARRGPPARAAGLVWAGSLLLLSGSGLAGLWHSVFWFEACPVHDAWQLIGDAGLARYARALGWLTMGSAAAVLAAAIPFQSDADPGAHGGQVV